ncbi:pre-mRNA-splicing factor cwc15 [Rhinocladiella mackenziei CBS 650.93]|uniref:Pre-mRNA-splicing factor cwc15 n=1 Tax=Rhinocladiella mackenziei CBS 650.93 TaxID=1442369 RepID=A0A0D2FNW5_9EURO|nr:pre-mRNA-splicing factor cwc15 [Rhinocladiella mackenziei CBS 650.93]KIX03797.1 pre-mRNA-splicing factor cwc15 [Rhinocladiella mackenziei CBS 650.93]
MTTGRRSTLLGAKKRNEVQPTINDFFQPTPFSKSGPQPGQGGAADSEKRDLRAELLAAEAAHFAKTRETATDNATGPPKPLKRDFNESPSDDENEDPETKRRRILEETREIDADSDGDDSGSSDEESDEDETAELMRELEKIKRERAEQKAKEEAEQAKQAQERREEDIALGNPLLNPKAFNLKRRWDDDVVFKNQARGTEQRGNKEFVNVCTCWIWMKLEGMDADKDTGFTAIRFSQKVYVQIHPIVVLDQVLTVATKFGDTESYL